jgi:hypothetical protein
MLPSYLRSVANAFPYAHAISASRAVLTRIVRLEGETAPDGNPVYLIQSQNVVAPID